MTAEELMIGDLVCVNRDGLCIKKGTIVEVRAVDADDKLIEKGLVGSAHCRPLDDNQFDGGIWCEYLDPLLLTPEILEKNGFKDIDKEYNCNGYDIYWTNGDGYSINTQDLHLHYVHELQHALKLCGIEREINL